jgi:uncharacterized protein DUF4342
MEKFDRIVEQFKVAGKDLADRVRELIHEGNVRRIIIRDERGHTFMEIPLTVATAGIVLAPLLTALAAIATVVAKFDVVVERSSPGGPPPPAPESPVTDSSVGATEDQVDMRDTAPKRTDQHGTRAEDVAGTGETDALGG